MTKYVLCDSGSSANRDSSYTTVTHPYNTVFLNTEFVFT